MKISDLFPKYAGRRGKFIDEESIFLIPRFGSDAFRWEQGNSIINMRPDSLTAEVELIDEPPMTVEKLISDAIEQYSEIVEPYYMEKTLRKIAAYAEAVGWNAAIEAAQELSERELTSTLAEDLENLKKELPR